MSHQGQKTENDRCLEWSSSLFKSYILRDANHPEMFLDNSRYHFPVHGLWRRKIVLVNFPCLNVYICTNKGLANSRCETEAGANK